MSWLYFIAGRVLIYGMEVAALTWDHVRGLRHEMGMGGDR